MTRSPSDVRRVAGPEFPPLVSVITPTIPGREHLLAECEASVRTQTFTRWEHVIVLDAKSEGCAKTMNLAAKAATGEWLLPLADDDFLTPGSLATFLSVADDTVDVVHAPPLVWGEPADQFYGDPPNMPSCALIRAATWAEARGYNEGLRHQEDRDFWERLLQRHKKFVKVTSGPTRVYRFWHDDVGGPGNKSRDGRRPPEPSRPPLAHNITDPGTTLG